MSPITEIAAVLEVYGGLFSGEDSLESARRWLDMGFVDPDEVDRWCCVGVWEPIVAARLRHEKLSPYDVLRGDRLIVEEQSSDCTDGSPTHAVCNGDLDIDVLIAAARRAARKRSPRHLRRS